MSDWEIVRHQVAIAGRVTDLQTGKAIAQALVQIVEQPDLTRTAADGHFHFLDLPDGDYTLVASLPGSGKRYGTGQAEAIVSRDAEGNITMSTADIALPPTTVKGQITDQDGDPVVMAEVRVQGSGERTFSDAQGQYILTGLETGKRTMLVSAQGYKSVSKTVLLSEPGTVQDLPLALISSTLLVGCKLWLKADTIIELSDGAPVNTWPDSSGNGNHATQTKAAKQPTFKANIINGKPVVRFDGIDDFMALSVSEPSTDHTFFFVFDLQTLGGHNSFLFDAKNGRLTLDSAGINSPHYIRWQDSTWHDIAAAVAGQQILTWVFSGTTGQVFRNGTSLGTSAYEPTSLGGKIALGSYHTGTQSRFEGDMAEVIYYNRALSTVDRQRVEQYLSNRYAIPLA